jgi:hypothetical protein
VVIFQKLLHGVGLLRVSRFPTRVEDEEYVVFVEGDIVERGFESWAEAHAYFILCTSKAVA